MNKSGIMTQDDMCIYKENGVVKALGWDIHSNLLKNDIPISTYYQSGGSIDSRVDNLAIPAGLVILNNTIDSKANVTNTRDMFISTTSPFDIHRNKLLNGGSKDGKNGSDVIEESLYEKLLGLSNRKKYLPHKTRKRKKNRRGASQNEQSKSKRKNKTRSKKNN